MILTSEQKQFFDDNGYLWFKQFYTTAFTRTLQSWFGEVEQWAETPGKWMKYFEPSPLNKEERMLCRVENFIPYHDGFRALLMDVKLIGIVSELMEEPAILFKEKINFKLPGGGAYKAHQDAPAFVSFKQTYHMTIMIGADPTTSKNGCLELVKAQHKKGTLKQSTDGTIHPEIIESLRWEALPTEPGDVLMFDSYVPHRSGPNLTSAPRRALYVTYNKLSEGDYRESYYQEKRKVFPPECERESGKDYSKGAGVYNLGNPIRV